LRAREPKELVLPTLSPFLSSGEITSVRTRIEMKIAMKYLAGMSWKIMGAFNIISNAIRACLVGHLSAIT